MISEVLMALGSWELTLSGAPRDVVDQIREFGHITFHEARQNPHTAGDAMLGSARYVGVVRGFSYTRDDTSDTVTVRGPGMGFWLGDEDGKGYVLETPAQFTIGRLPDVATALLPPSVTPGRLVDITSALPYSGSFVYCTPRAALTEVCAYFPDSYGSAEWRVNGDATVDVGSISELYRVQPQAIIVREPPAVDIGLRGITGGGTVDIDREDWATRVVFLGEDEGDDVAVGTADLDPAGNPFLDLQGNPIILTKVVSESTTQAVNVDLAAELALADISGPHTAVDLDLDELSVSGDVRVGDYVYVWDPDSGLVDKSLSGPTVAFRGRRLNPVTIRVVEMSWPVLDGMGVAYRGGDGVWIDLTDWVAPETGSTQLVVGGAPRALLDRPALPNARGYRNSTVPDQTSWARDTPVTITTTRSSTGAVRVQVLLRWREPRNTDGSLIRDGDRYEISWHSTELPRQSTGWNELNRPWSELGTWNYLVPVITEPVWSYEIVAFDRQQVVLSDLTPGTSYEARVRAVDASRPPNYGEWSATLPFTTPSS